MAYFPDANYRGQYSIIGCCCCCCCSKSTKSTGNAISLILIDASTMKLPWENIPTEKMNPFNHLLFDLNWWVDNNLTLQVQHLLCSLPKESEQKIFKVIVKSLTMLSNKISTLWSKPLAGSAHLLMIQEIENSLLRRGYEWGLCYKLDTLEQ